jgi:hypothetical protein
MGETTGSNDSKGSNRVGISVPLSEYGTDPVSETSSLLVFRIPDYRNPVILSSYERFATKQGSDPQLEETGFTVHHNRVSSDAICSEFSI